MKVNFAGTPGASDRERQWQRLLKRRLLSYWDIQQEQFSVPFAFSYIKHKKMEGKKIDLFLDSGAYSAKTQGVTIDLKEYIAFIKRNKEFIDIYANLDVIGSAEKTWDNHVLMAKAGLSPLPVFHYGEDTKWLKKYLDSGVDYIALGGLVGGSNDALIHWLDSIWSNFLTDDKGLPKIKVHGFGLTSLPMMLRYPWYSVDSTSWVITGRMGGIFTPRWADDKWIYDGSSWKVSVSNRSPDKKEAGQHISTLSPGVKKIIMRYIEEKGYILGESEYKWESQDYKPIVGKESWVGKKPLNKSEKREVEIIIEPGISNKYQLRDEMNIIYFQDLEKSMPTYPWSFHEKKIQKSLFK